MRAFGMDVCVHGRPVKKYKHEGEVYIEGRSGSEYTLKIYNNTKRRVLVAVSVDGLSVMNGEPASRKVGAGGGYIVNASSWLEIPGWRLDNTSVARFEFGGVPESYAGRKRKAAHVGVIGCVAYYEIEDWAPRSFLDSSNFKGGSPLRDHEYSGGIRTSSLKSRSSNLGTGFGREDSHQVRQVDFRAEGHAADELVIHYDDLEGLKARGIELHPPKAEVAPNPFPADAEVGCTPPPGWKGNR